MNSFGSFILVAQCQIYAYSGCANSMGNRPPHREPTPWEIYLAPNLKTRPKYLQHTTDPSSPPSPAPTRPPERREKQADRSRAEIACPPLLFTVAGEKGKEE